jgi:hypothetical protein
MVWDLGFMVWDLGFRVKAWGDSSSMNSVTFNLEGERLVFEVLMGQG